MSMPAWSSSNHHRLQQPESTSTYKASELRCPPPLARGEQQPPRRECSRAVIISSRRQQLWIKLPPPCAAADLPVDPEQQQPPPLRRQHEDHQLDTNGHLSPLCVNNVVSKASSPNMHDTQPSDDALGGNYCRWHVKVAAHNTQRVANCFCTQWWHRVVAHGIGTE